MAKEGYPAFVHWQGARDSQLQVHPQPGENVAGIIYVPVGVMGFYPEGVGVSRQGFDLGECEMCGTSEVYNL